MARILFLMILAFGLTHPVLADEPMSKPILTGLKRYGPVAVGPDGKIYVAKENDREGLTDVVAVEQNKTVPFATGFIRIHSMVWYQKWLFVNDSTTNDSTTIWKIHSKDKKEAFFSTNSIPSGFTQPQGRTFYGMTVDPENGNLYVIYHVLLDYNKGATAAQIFRVDAKGKASPITEAVKETNAGPSVLILDGASHLLVGDHNRELQRVRISDGKAEKVARIDGKFSGLAWDMHGRLYISDIVKGQLLVIPRPGMSPIALKERFKAPIGICLGPNRQSILVPDSDAGTITAIPAAVPGQPVDESPLPLETAIAFPDLKWAGWKGETDAGKINPLRPIALTHAGDGSNRAFVAIQQGTIHVFPNDQTAKETKVFLDIQDKVRYKDNENEEGFLGFCFHPDYKKTGEFFVFYTPRNQKLVNVVSRFKVSKDDPDKADLASEEIIFSVKRPFWNHDGGTICFGPDGMLYIALGDGGAANDPFDNGQNLKSPLGKILRIDINKKQGGRNYAIPPDNPFVARTDTIQETWAYGLRNVWRMSFDRKTGKLWAGEVGQNLYEEINIIEKGGNYGWRRRESLHPFGANGHGHRADMIDPIWEYHHDIGKSITGGHVYRGKLLPELEGHYLCADYVTGKIWALMYGEKEKRVTAWRPIRDKALPIMSFGEDEMGEVYLMTYAASGRGIYRFVQANVKK